MGVHACRAYFRPIFLFAAFVTLLGAFLLTPSGILGICRLFCGIKYGDTCGDARIGGK